MLNQGLTDEPKIFLFNVFEVESFLQNFINTFDLNKRLITSVA